MAQVYRATEPSALTTLTNQSIEQSQSASQNQHVELVLLQPLAKAEMLAASRNPASRYMRDGDGNRMGLTNSEYLNLTRLGKAWRQEWANFPLESISQVTFIAALPQGQDNTGPHGNIFWPGTTPSRGGIAVTQHDFKNLAITLATAAKMRCRHELRFDVTYDVASEHAGVFRLLQHHLEVLSAWRRSEEEVTAPG